MNELKSFESERIYWAVEQVERVAGDIDNLHLDDNLFYIKSEADKVIAELEMKLAAAKLVLRLNEPKALYSNLDTMSRLNHKIDVVERRELHQKYKRCLAMAERWLFAFYVTNKCNDKFYLRSLKYRELAEQFRRRSDALHRLHHKGNRVLPQGKPDGTEIYSFRKDCNT